jgi:hypothetical protein
MAANRARNLAAIRNTCGRERVRFSFALACCPPRDACDAVAVPAGTPRSAELLDGGMSSDATSPPHDLRMKRNRRAPTGPMDSSTDGTRILHSHSPREQSVDSRCVCLPRIMLRRGPGANPAPGREIRVRQNVPGAGSVRFLACRSGRCIPPQHPSCIMLQQRSMTLVTRDWSYSAEGKDTDLA